MQQIFTVARKEFLDIIRDRRTLLVMVIIPTLLFPTILYFLTTIQSNQYKKNQAKTLKLAWIGEDAELESFFKQWDNIEVISLDQIEGVNELIKTDSFDLALEVSEEFGDDINQMKRGKLTLYFPSTEDGQLKKRVTNVLDQYEQKIRRKRLRTLEITETQIDPILIREEDISSKKEVIGKNAGGFIPYIFILFSFMGITYPAIDLFAGEKERGTLETILTVPISRIQILFGKMLVVATSGVISALLGITGLVLSIQLIDAIPTEILDALGDIVQIQSILLVLILIIPLAIFFAGLLIPISSYAKSSKEAQSMIGPLNIIVIIPAAIGLLPGIELNWGTAFIPILNVALATKEVVAGTIHMGHYAVVFLSLILLASTLVYVSTTQFASEKNIIRS